MFPFALRGEYFLFSSSNTFDAFALNVDAYTCILHFAILTLEKTLCFIPDN
jgi:hypothetical protein